MERQIDRLIDNYIEKQIEKTARLDGQIRAYTHRCMAMT